MSNSIPAKISNEKETILPDAIEPFNINKTLETIENDLSFSSCLKNLRLQNLKSLEASTISAYNCLSTKPLKRFAC